MYAFPIAILFVGNISWLIARHKKWSFISYLYMLYQVTFMELNHDAKAYAYLSIKKPPTKHMATLGHEYHAYR